MATCADETVFYENLDALKVSSKGKDSKNSKNSGLCSREKFKTKMEDLLLQNETSSKH